MLGDIFIRFPTHHLPPLVRHDQRITPDDAAKFARIDERLFKLSGAAVHSKTTDCGSGGRSVASLSKRNTVGLKRAEMGSVDHGE